MENWESFLLAEVGASAALAGLIFVGMSINLRRILSLPNLPARGLEALVVLVTVLVVSSLLLVPGQPLTVQGIELLAVGLAAWIIVVLLDRDIWRKTKAKYRKTYRFLILLNQFTVLPYIIAGITILVWGETGMYWLVPSVISSFIKALADAWVLLVEINR